MRTPTIPVLFAAGILMAMVGLACVAPGSRPTGQAPSASAAASPGPGSPAASGLATTGPTASDVPAVLVGAGDIASCTSSGDEATSALLDGTTGTVFTAGDNVYDKGSAAEFSACYDPSWGRHRARTMPVPGNHDYGTPGASGYFDYFGSTAGDPAQGWYTTEVGAWRVYVLNSNCAAIGGCGAGSSQELWPRADLAANPNRCAMAIWHHPLFSSGEHGSSAATKALWEALQDAGAEIVVNGHDHDYERFAPQAADGAPDPATGIVEYVVGTGGRSHYAVTSAIANSVVRNDDTFGVIRFDLYPDRWSFTFVPVAGKTFTDAGSGTCH